MDCEIDYKPKDEVDEIIKTRGKNMSYYCYWAILRNIIIDYIDNSMTYVECEHMHRCAMAKFIVNKERENADKMEGRDSE